MKISAHTTGENGTPGPRNTRIDSTRRTDVFFRYALAFYPTRGELWEQIIVTLARTTP